MVVQDYRDLSSTPHPNLGGIMLRQLRQLKGIKVQDLNLRIFEILPGTENPLHAHVYSHALFVLQGEGIIRHENGDHHIKEGDVVFIERDEAHSFANPGVELFRFLCIDYCALEG